MRSKWQCPACGGGDPQWTHTLSVADAASNFVRPWIDRDRHRRLTDCIAGLWGGDRVRLVRCGQCGLRSADPFVAGDARFYALAYAQESLHPYPASRWEYGLTRALIASVQGSVFEIGAGDGAFQRSIIADGVEPSRLYATEFSDSARRVLAGVGVTVSGSDFRQLPAADHSLVCAHQVFEHLDGLDEAFDAFDRLTTADGVVALSVPNGAHVEQTELAGGLVDMPPNHISTWGPKAFNAVACRHGWQVVDFREEPISRMRAAKELAISRSFRARSRHRSTAALAERWAPSPRVRYLATAAAAAGQLPSAYIAASTPHGGSLWVAMKRR